MKEIKYSLRLTEEEKEKYQKFAEERKTTLSSLIRNALDSAIDNPSMLNPAATKFGIDIILDVLELEGNKRIQYNQDFKNELTHRLQIMDNKINRLMKKAKIPKKEIAELEGELDGGVIFE